MPPACCPLLWAVSAGRPASAATYARDIAALARPRRNRPRQSPPRGYARPARQLPRPRPPGGTIQAIQVEGNQRIEAGTIRSYMLVQPGDPFDPDRLDRSLKTLYATGLFQDVRLEPPGQHAGRARGGKPAGQPGRLRGQPQARATTSSRPEVQLQAARGVSRRRWPRPTAARSSICMPRRATTTPRVTPQIIRLPQNRVDVVFQINDGPSTLISKIAFVGNHAFSEGRLSEVINSREGALVALPVDVGPVRPGAARTTTRNCCAGST